MLRKVFRGKVRIESAPVDAVYNNLFFGMQGTGGSTTVASEWERFRKVGAAARLMLVQAAAQQWNVKASDCRVEKGVVLHVASSRKATYGSLGEAASKLPVPSEIPLKNEAQFTQVGKPTRRLDTPSKLDGSAQFGLSGRARCAAGRTCSRKCFVRSDRPSDSAAAHTPERRARQIGRGLMKTGSSSAEDSDRCRMWIP